MTSRPAQSVDRPHADAAIVEQLHGEDPARFLYLCGEQSVTTTVQSLLDGMCDPTRIQLWLRVEREVFGGRPGPMTRLAKAQARIQGDNESAVEAAGDSEPEDDDPALPVDGGDRPEHGTDTGSEQSSDVPVAVRDDAFEERVQNAMAIVATFDVPMAREKLQDERAREQPRAHVLEALQRRLDELGASGPNTAADSAPEVSG